MAWTATLIWRVVGAWLKALSILASLVRKGVMGSAAMVFPFSRTFTNATVFRDGCGHGFVLPVILPYLDTEDAAV